MAKRSAWALSPLVQGIIVAVAVALGLLVLFVIVPIFTRNRPAPVAQKTPAPLPSGFFKPTNDEWESLTIARVQDRRFANESETQGTITPPDNATTQVFSPYTGRVTAVYATVGDTIAAGSPLFAIDGAEYAQAQNDLVTAMQTLHAADVQLRVTAINRTHLLSLANTDGASGKDVAQSSADLASAEVTARNAKTAVALVRSRLAVLGFSNGEMDHLAKAAGPRATLSTAVIVRAPIGGVVMQRAVGVGQNVQSAAGGSSDALLTITDLSHVYFSAAVAETAIAKVHTGDRISVRMVAFPQRTFDALVSYVAPALDTNTHRIMVRAEVANPDLALKPGMFGSMTIDSGGGSVGVAVPEQAVIFEGDSARVWITGPNRTLALRYVKVEPTVDGLVPVVAGLAPGDRVVTTGSVFIDRAASGGD
jgi:cobalt-zinc-cadmium efflux system membrane fusion protein